MTCTARTFTAALAAAILALAAAPAPAADLHGQLGVEAGGLDHPLGIAVEPSSPYLNGNLDLNLAAPTGASVWKFSYSGGTYLFDPETALDFARHAVGVEWLKPAAREALTFSTGLQVSLRRNETAYSVYDYDELFWYSALKTYPHPQLMVRGYAGLRVRRYDLLPEESYLEPHAVLELKRFWNNRTTLGATLRAGGKWFHDEVAPNVWGTDGTPYAAQASASLDLAKGLSDRLGLSASAQQRFDLAGFPYYVEADVFDSPLLDRYARSGPAVRGALKVLTAAQLWLEGGAAWRRDDYGAILFDDGAAGATRTDTITDLFLSLERPFLKQGKGAVLQATVTWRDQASTLPGYTWEGLTLATGLQWRF
ncbi:MAG TPA: hypothetical protein PLQ13_00435 [Candidatus Krumholzibacteria bacterium]|nr:hypothetical protein [Candidatus Krumholzibacteria bacterium]